MKRRRANEVSAMISQTGKLLSADCSRQHSSVQCYAERSDCNYTTITPRDPKQIDDHSTHHGDETLILLDEWKSSDEVIKVVWLPGGSVALLSLAKSGGKAELLRAVFRAVGRFVEYQSRTKVNGVCLLVNRVGGNPSDEVQTPMLMGCFSGPKRE